MAFSVTDIECEDYWDSKCWESLTQAVVGEYKARCRSTQTCASLAASGGAGLGTAEPVTTSTRWQSLDAFSQMSCMERRELQVPEAAVEPQSPTHSAVGSRNATRLNSSNAGSSSWQTADEASGSFAGLVSFDGPGLNANAVAESTAPPPCTFAGDDSEPVSLRAADEHCDLLGARLCTVMELLEGLPKFDCTADDTSTGTAFWTRTQNDCEELGSYWVVEYSPQPDSVLSEGLSCRDKSLEVAHAWCCADTTVSECKPDWYNYTDVADVDGGFWGSWNWTDAALDESFDIEISVGKAVGSSVGIAAWCLCSLWMCYLGKGYMVKRVKNYKESRAAKRSSQDRDTMMNLSRSLSLSGGIDDYY
eukprot:SAG22_NODE_332_length_12161_cov_7.722066_7_plen_362_part_01